VYTTAGVLLLSAALATHSPLTVLPATAYFWMAMVAVVSQVIGHSALNWALGHLTATTVSLAIRAEPVIATLLAIPVLGETPPWTAGLGGLLVMVGVYLAVRAESPR
jgi:drug/metabolite transporter (DMT)-like permease